MPCLSSSQTEKTKAKERFFFGVSIGATFDLVKILQKGASCRQCWKCQRELLLALILNLSTLLRMPILGPTYSPYLKLPKTTTIYKYLCKIILPGCASSHLVQIPLLELGTTPPFVRILALLQSIPYSALPVPPLG